METNVITTKEAKDRSRMQESALAEHTKLKEALTKSLGADPETKIAWDSADFSWKTLKNKYRDALAESSNTASTLGQLFRYGVQRLMFDAYKEVPVVYPDIVQFMPSKNRQEWYAPLYGAEVPVDVPFGDKFPDSRIKGLDQVVVNKKVGRMLTMERELFDYDQTGQIADRASKMGARIKYKEETDVMAAVEGATYSVALGNTPSGTAVLSQPGLEAADIALMNILDPMGNKMLVMPSLLLISAADKFNAAKLIGSALQPSIPGTAGLDHAGSSGTGMVGGQTGWTMTINPLQGLYSIKVSRFLSSTTKPWYLMEPKTSIPFQEASAVEIVQENPLAGASFEQDIYRWRVRRLYAVAVIESRYIYKGN